MEWELASNRPNSSVATVNPMLDSIAACAESFLMALSHFAFQPSWEAIFIITSILQMKKPRLKGANSLTQDPPRASLFS